MLKQARNVLTLRSEGVACKRGVGVLPAGGKYFGIIGFDAVGPKDVEL